MQEALVTTSIDHEAATRSDEAITQNRAAQRGQQLAIAKSLIAAALSARPASVSELIDAAAQQNQAPGASAAEVFWELVRLRLFDAHGRLRPRPVHAAR